MRRWGIAFIACLLLLTGCLNKDDAKDSSGEEEQSPAGEELASLSKADQEMKEPADPAVPAASSRKIIYRADLDVRVRDFEAALSQIEQETKRAGGYMVNIISSDAAEKGEREGTITVRVPQAKFSAFLNTMEKGTFELQSREVAGQDVTEEYVDLESRLKAKEAVETRLLSFMKDSQKTSDLLAISKDLAGVQEEIEQLKGRRNYLQNQTDFAAITITLSESGVMVPHADGGTWEKTQQQFITSLNSLLAAGSSIFIFIAGNLPLWLVLGAIAWGVYAFWKKRRAAAAEE
ncbi:DUF4349 domain-containing protein [Metabacillus mangrovi]|nr:DUF4349 domain-containing protein [Metabacillus mangrovi]